MADEKRIAGRMEVPERTVIRKSRKKSVAIVVSGALAGVAGGFLLHDADRATAGWCLVIAAGFALLLGLGSLFDRRPYLVLTERGLTDLFSIREEIEWEAMIYVDAVWFRGQYFVRIVLDRAYKADTIRSTMLRRFDGIYASEALKAVYIRTGGLEIGSVQLVDLIRRMKESTPAERSEWLARGRGV